MKLLKKDSTGIQVKATMDLGSSFGGFIIQGSVFFALVYTSCLLYMEQANDVNIYHILFLVVMNFICYYFLIHTCITRNLNSIHIAKEGITHKTPFKNKFYSALSIKKVLPYYTLIKSRRGSGNTHIVEIFADLNDGSRVNVFYMENPYWEEKDEEIYSEFVNILKTLGYCGSDDFEQ
jgi:hypothetical protein